MSTRRCATTAPRKQSSIRCRLAPSCTTTWVITPTNRSSIRFSRRACDERCAGATKIRTCHTKAPNMSEAPAAPKPKKSVALSGVTVGNTALCTVGRTGNDLHYRGYDILDLADTSEFEEIAYLLVHGKLPGIAELAAYKAKLKSLRGIPARVMTVLEQLPSAAHPMDVMRTATSALGSALPERDDHAPAGARDIADRL